MTIGSKEHDEIIVNFDKEYYYLNLIKEEKELWYKGQIYANGETNNLFKAYSLGYSFGRLNYLN
ncbi:MAG: hypothetical protein M0P71_17430 [Melioribacteraceae bacterium]|nr:hypothetical protein [Melioribacteraceae bacterium]